LFSVFSPEFRDEEKMGTRLLLFWELQAGACFRSRYHGLSYVDYVRDRVSVSMLLFHREREEVGHLDTLAVALPNRQVSNMSNLALVEELGFVPCYNLLFGLSSSS
jgi:hypothetical protein